MAWVKQIFVGRPLDTAELGEQKISKKAALPVLSSDALSSTAYATEEMLLALTLAGAASFSVSIPAAFLIVGLLAIVITSYSQVLEAYPQGGGAYAVVKENLGIYPALVTGASLLIDYVLTVAVSIAAGIAAITSVFPNLYESGISFLALRLLQLYTLVPPAEPSEHNVFSQTVPPARNRLPWLLKTPCTGFQDQLFQTTLHSGG
jgi:amino acid transporter